MPTKSTVKRCTLRSVQSVDSNNQMTIAINDEDGNVISFSLPTEGAQKLSQWTANYLRDHAAKESEQMIALEWESIADAYGKEIELMKSLGLRASQQTESPHHQLEKHQPWLKTFRALLPNWIQGSADRGEHQ